MAKLSLKQIAISAALIIAGIRKLLGDEAVQVICLPRSMSNAELVAFRQAFPEAHVSKDR